MSLALIDIDGTIADTLDALKGYFEHCGEIFKPENVETYNFGGDIGIEKEQVYSALVDEELYERLKPYDGVLSAINRLKGYHKVVAYTSMPSWGTLQAKRLEFCKQFGFDDILIFSGTKPIIDDVAVLFDDCLEVHELWSKEPQVRQYLINQSYNQEINFEKFCSLKDKLFRAKNFCKAVDDYINYLES